MDRRYRILLLICFVSLGALVARLFYWQVIKASELSNSARLQYQDSVKLHATRGNILSQDGNWLAGSQDVWLLYAYLTDFKDNPRETAIKLVELIVEDKSDQKFIDEEKDRITSLLSRKDTSWVALKQKVKTETKNKILELNISGLGFDKRETRAYPEGSASAHLLGFVGKDEEGNDRGYFGLEGYYQLQLAGKDGFLQRESDARGAPILFGSHKETKALSGVDLLTNIDKTVQITVEKKLKEGIDKYGAVSGSAIVLNPQTGAVMAMASFPTYDPANYYDYSNELFKNPIISDSFEPGSIFKPIVMAAGLDAKVIEPETVCDICSGPFKVDKYFIETWDQKYWANSTMTEVLLHSDNVGMTFVGNKLGSDKLYDYLDAFGFGNLTQIDLQGEANPGLRPKNTWNIVDLATATFGQGIAVTPIQMAKAMAIIANGGMQVHPKLVSTIMQGDWKQEITTESKRRVISKEASEKVTRMMIAAVKQGEAKWAVPKGYSIAGKTGTAQIPVSGHYDEEKTIASFIGFAPPFNPKFLMLIILREPQTSQWASETSAPLWFDIAKVLFPYLGIEP